MKKEYITKKGYENLYKSYLEMDKAIADTQRAMGESAKRDNDLRENPEYMSLRVEAMYTLPNQKRQLYERCQNVIIIEETEEYKNFDGNTVIIGSEVKLLIDGEEEIYTILGDNEGDLKKSIISCQSPMAKSILNKHIGEKTEFNGMEISILDVKKI